MCKAFSCIVTDKGEALWKFGVDSHGELETLFKLRDLTAKPSELRHAKVEISPDNGNYLAPDHWTLHIDEQRTPDWWEPGCEKAAWKAHRAWLRELHSVLVRKRIVNPFEIKPPKKITKKHLGLLKQWDSVGDSVWASVMDSVWDSVWASVMDSVWDSVWAYTGSFFNLPRNAWKYTEKIPGKGYPFQCAVDLWQMGLVPSYDGKAWRLHGGKDAKILWEGKV